MATYKIPQDVEAEDKFFGPLTFKQFLFAGGSLVSGYLVFLFFSTQIWFLSVLFLLPFLFFTALAVPWSKDQPTELWLAARIRFFLVPHRRIWDQTGVKDLVQITVPKREVHIYTDGLTQDQVMNRLEALATVVDTRGWAVKNAQFTTAADSSTDRLVSIEQAAPTDEQVIVQQATDVMDIQSNQTAQTLDTKIKKVEDEHRKKTLAMIEEARQSSQVKQSGAGPSQQTSSALDNSFQNTKTMSANNKPIDTDWFMQENTAPPDPTLARFQSLVDIKPGENPTQVPAAPTPKIDPNTEQQFLSHMHQQQQRDAALKAQSHMKNIAPLADDAVATTGAQPTDPAILALADNDDLNVATIARQAQQKTEDDDEVVVPLR